MNEFKSAIRVAVAAAVAYLLTWLSTVLPVEIPGKEVLENSLVELIFAVVVYYFARLAERYFNVPALIIKKPSDIK